MSNDAIAKGKLLFGPLFDWNPRSQPPSGRIARLRFGRLLQGTVANRSVEITVCQNAKRQRAQAGQLPLGALHVGFVIANQRHFNPPIVQTPAGSVARIGPVFTPAHLRGRGYASAVTAALSDELLQRCAVVMLFTDAANPTSNAVYARLGYKVVADVVEVSFAESPGQVDSPSIP